MAEIRAVLVTGLHHLVEDRLGEGALRAVSRRHRQARGRVVAAIGPARPV